MTSLIQHRQKMKKKNSAEEIDDLCRKIAEIAIYNNLNLFVVVADFVSKLDDYRFKDWKTKNETTND